MGLTGEIPPILTCAHYSEVVNPSIDLTPDKQPKFASSVVLCICSSLSPSETRYIWCLTPIKMAKSIVFVCILI